MKFAIIFVTIIFLVLGACFVYFTYIRKDSFKGIYGTPFHFSGNNTNDKTYTGIPNSSPDPLTGGFTQTLPSTASKTRLHLPATIDEIFYNEYTGIVGFGVHAGGHIEGLDHIWMQLKPGTPLRSWGDGTVTDIHNQSDGPSQNDWYITIDYGDGLIGKHQLAAKAMVKVGDKVKAGQVIGEAGTEDSHYGDAEFCLMDSNRTDGVSTGGGSIYVSPYDYLVDADKIALVNAYKTRYIDKYFTNGHTLPVYAYPLFYPFQPYLTNPILIPSGSRGDLPGEWLRTSGWSQNGELDVLNIFDSDTPYYQGYYALGSNYFQSSQTGKYILNGKMTIDYTKNQFIIQNKSDNKTTSLYGIFKVNKSSVHPTLEIEYQENTYPTQFDNQAIKMSAREPIYLKGNLDDLGVQMFGTR